MKKNTNKLEAIYNKYCNIQPDDDKGKLTLGQATQLFRKATGLGGKKKTYFSTDTVREILKCALPPYGGGMKKTYFLTASEICFCAKNWHRICIKKMKKPNKYQQTIIDGFGENKQEAWTTPTPPKENQLLMFPSNNDNMEFQVEEGTVHGNSADGYVVSFTNYDGKTWYRYY